jgi:aspartate racemase
VAVQKFFHIGIWPLSAAGGGLFFLELGRYRPRRLAAHEHPEITLSIRPMRPTLQAYDRGDHPWLKAYMGASVQRLADAGCDFFVCPDNTAHIALESEGAPLALPGLHIADIVAQQAKGDGRSCIALLGTKWTMEGPVYQGAFARAGLDMRTPPAADRTRVDDIIFGELTQGVLTDESRAAYVRIIAAMQREGCDAVALSCTEIPLLITPEVSPLPTLDATRLLAHAAVAVALGQKERPTWRGGAFK